MDIHNPYLLSGHIQLIISCPDLSLPKGVNSFIPVISCTRLKENAKDAKDAKGAIEIFASFASFASFALFFNGFAIEIVLNAKDAKDAKGAISLKISVNQCSIQNFKLNKFIAQLVYQLSVISYQLSVISYRLLVINALISSIRKANIFNLT
ncbi:MAG TPA: hypothetical protein ENF37_00525 [Beggiatoa sp.]|nr:MAG: hypothetical protein DRQ99_23680 [Gammaproteobacteria bacterium]HEW97118.1 hypothetical protein [Beggiatoa sp.]